MKENVSTLYGIWSLLFQALSDLSTALLCQPVVSPSPCSTRWLLVGPSSFLKLPFTSGTVFFQNTMHLKQHQCSLAFTELKDNKRSKANTFADRGTSIWLFVVPLWRTMLVPQAAAQLPSRRGGSHSVPLCHLLQNAHSPKHSSSAQEGVCQKKGPTNFAARPPHSWTG